MRIYPHESQTEADPAQAHLQVQTRGHSGRPPERALWHPRVPSCEDVTKAHVVVAAAVLGAYGRVQACAGERPPGSA